MKHMKILGLAIVVAVVLTAILGAGSAAASRLIQTTSGGVTDTLGVGTHIEATLEAGNSALIEDPSGFTATTCTGSTITGSIERVTPTGQPKGVLSTLDFNGCPAIHNVKTLANGSLEIRNIAGTTNGTLFSYSTRVEFFNTILNQNCIANTGTGTDVGTLTAAGSASGTATLDISGLIPVEGCAASNIRWTGKYEVTTPKGLEVEAS